MNTTDSEVNPRSFVIGLLAVLVVLGFGIFVGAIRPEIEAEKARKEKYMRDHNCKLSGYYGRHGNRKVYECDTGVFKENEL